MFSSISRLPESATQLISSYMVIVTPSLVVKELLDNAIDAKATSVEILISPDTISRVEVRDNGVGIHPDDFDALGRRGYTSKLGKIEELGTIVRKSLGFRGEALASLNSMANVTITTKTSTEPVATAFQLTPNEGGVLAYKSASAPTGTTVSVTNLFGRQPVRQQMAAREAKKTLEKIQEVLRSYIMARPQLKILFRVLHTPTKTWSYSPKRNATVIEATLQLFGTEVTSNCFLKTFRTSYTITNGDSPAPGLSRPATGHFLLEAFLADPDVDLQNMPKCHYFSIDGRPMNASRGVAKRLSKIYREHLRRSTMVKEISDCFIRLNICCPPGSYDANIEPSKDDILFSDEQAIADAFRHLCNETYTPAAVDYQDTCTESSQADGVPTTSSPGEGQLRRIRSSQTQLRLPDCTPQISIEVPHDDPKCSIDQASPAQKPGGDQESQKSPTSDSMSFMPIDTRNHPSSGEQSEHLTAPNQSKVGMSIDLNERPNRSHQQRLQVPRESLASQEKKIGGERKVSDHLTPWVIAKTNGLSKVSDPECDSGCSLTPEPPILRHILAPPGDLDILRSHRETERTKFPCLQRSTIPGGPYRSPMASPSGSKSLGVPVVPLNYSHMTRHRRRREQLPWTPPSSVEKHRYIDVSQIDSIHSARADSFKQTRLSFGGAQSSRLRDGTLGGVSQAEARSEGLPSELEANRNLNIQDIFTTAKKNLQYQLSLMGEDQVTKIVHSDESQRRRQQPSRQQLSRQRQPFSVTKTNTPQNGDASPEVRQPIATTLPIGDPRAYLLRRQKSMAAEGSGAKLKKLSRLKSSLMPLENTPPEYQTHLICWTVSLGRSALNELVGWMRKYDEYVIYGTLVDGLDMSLSDGRVVESQLQKLLAEQKKNLANGETGDDTVIINLQAMLKGKSVLDV